MNSILLWEMFFERFFFFWGGGSHKNVSQILATFDFQGWKSDMGIDGHTFVPKKWLIFTSLGQGLSQKVGLFLIFDPILQAGFLTKCWFFQSRNPPSSLFLAFLVVVFSQFCSNII